MDINDKNDKIENLNFYEIESEWERFDFDSSVSQDLQAQQLKNSLEKLVHYSGKLYVILSGIYSFPRNAFASVDQKINIKKKIGKTITVLGDEVVDSYVYQPLILNSKKITTKIAKKIPRFLVDPVPLNDLLNSSIFSKTIPVTESKISSKMQFLLDAAKIDQLEKVRKTVQSNPNPFELLNNVSSERIPKFSLEKTGMKFIKYPKKAVESHLTNPTFTSSLISSFFIYVPLSIFSFIGLETGFKVGRWVLKKAFQRKEKEPENKGFNPAELLNHLPSFSKEEKKEKPVLSLGEKFFLFTIFAVIIRFVFPGKAGELDRDLKNRFTHVLEDWNLIKPKPWYRKWADNLYFLIDYQTVTPYLIVSAFTLAYLYYKNPKIFWEYYSRASSPIKDMLLTVTTFLSTVIEIVVKQADKSVEIQKLSTTEIKDVLLKTNELQKEQIKTVEDKLNILDVKERACLSEKLDIVVEKNKVENSYDLCKNEKNNLINFSNQAVLKGTECYTQLDTLVNNVREVTYQIARNPEICNAMTRDGGTPAVVQQLEKIQASKGLTPIQQLDLTLQNVDYPKIAPATENKKKDGLFSGRNKNK